MTGTTPPTTTFCSSEISKLNIIIFKNKYFRPLQPTAFITNFGEKVNKESVNFTRLIYPYIII